MATGNTKLQRANDTKLVAKQGEGRLINKDNTRVAPAPQTPSQPPPKPVTITPHGKENRQYRRRGH